MCCFSYDATLTIEMNSIYAITLLVKGLTGIFGLSEIMHYSIRPRVNLFESVGRMPES